ncbi:unnamed protein product [Coffea canephora]|uniref:Uncharacterized protein n=1 Tax=Coffea canephora TaxID=49390 RepID=A0A068TST6_COFCA|nr:unnamed protein product [Coffea canephora]
MISLEKSKRKNLIETSSLFTRYFLLLPVATGTEDKRRKSQYPPPQLPFFPPWRRSRCSIYAGMNLSGDNIYCM